MKIKRKSISHLYQPNYKGESKYKTYVDKTISLKQSNFIRIFNICKSPNYPWRAKPVTYKPQLDATRSFETNLIIKKYNFEFKKGSSSHLSQKYIQTLNDLLNLKSQKKYLPMRLKMLKDNNIKSTFITQPFIYNKSQHSNNKNLFITGYNNQLKKKENKETKNKQITMSMPLLNKYNYVNTEIKITKETSNVNTDVVQKDILKESITLNKRNKCDTQEPDIFIRPYNEKINQIERVNELTKQFQFYTIEDCKSTLSPKYNRNKNRKYCSSDGDAIYLNKPYESQFSSQKYFFQVLAMRKKKEKNINNK